MHLATRAKEDSRRAGVAHEELQEMADDRQRWKERVAVRKGKADPELTWQRGRRKTAEGLEWHIKNYKKWQMTDRV